jgi:hypothetical protein
MCFNLFVGSEMAIMLCPTFCWATNLSVIWACEYAKRGFTTDQANEITTCYSDRYRDRTAWDRLHPKLKPNLDKVGALRRSRRMRSAIFGMTLSQWYCLIGGHPRRSTGPSYGQTLSDNSSQSDR